MANKLPITILNGELAGRSYEVTKGELRLGRSSSNDICIADGELSRNHCLFGLRGDELCLTDIASANGTYLNGQRIGDTAVTLHDGDIVEVGTTKIRIGSERQESPPTGVDLGLETKPEEAAKPSTRSPIMNLVWIVVIALLGVAGWLFVSQRTEKEAAPTPIEGEEDPVISEILYERVMANTEGIFRYELSLSADKVMTVKLDDVPKADRHLVKSVPLSETAEKELNDILAFQTLRQLDREYVGADPDPQSLDSFCLKVVYLTRSRTVKVVNTQEPEVFREIREKLEAFSKSELGIWAIQYPREKLVELAEKAIEVGKAKWDDRDVKFGNLWDSIVAYNEAIFYMETLNPKPDGFAVARDGLRRSQEELNSRYQDQRFLADRALNMKQWEMAKRELGTLLEMIPDRKDDRNRDASTKLLTVEKNLQKGDR